jgi:hypothetical protein
MNMNLSIVLVDKRHYRKIAQDNWGLTKEQMKGKHVHHRIPVSRGGTNDPSNLYVCSPSFHRWGWHNGEEWIEWAQAGGIMGAISSQEKRAKDPVWREKEKVRNTASAKQSHLKGKGTQEYSDRQKLKSLKTHPPKRQNQGWDQQAYDLVWGCHIEGLQSGYLIAKRAGAVQWKKYSNMLKYASLGFSYEQLMLTEQYLNEVKRIEESPIAHILSKYDD